MAGVAKGRFCGLAISKRVNSMRLKYILLFGLLVACAGRSAGQSVQWASEVVSVSSEMRGEPNTRQFRASQALGRPSRLPGVGETPCAWSPASADAGPNEFIRVRFARSQRVRQVVVAENVNPGAVAQVSVFDERGTEHIVFKNGLFQPRPEPLLAILVDSAITGREVKVTLNTAKIKGINQIDAIGISDAATPIPVGINVVREALKDGEKENLGKTVNSVGEEIAPVISPDGRSLFFTRFPNKNNIGSPDRQDVWSSTLGPNGVWGEAVNMGAPINNADDNAVSSISPDGRIIYLLNIYQPNGRMSFGISRSVRTKVGWSAPVECKIQNNLPVNNNNKLEFAVSPNGQTMVLAVQRKDSYGERDLYVTFRKSDLTWTEPKQMGPVLNTADAEAAPFIAADGRSLYFTSAGQPGYGDSDIYISRRLDDTWLNWSEPENLGPGVNTDEWDGYFTIPASGEFAYLSSQANSLGEGDIFRVRLPQSLRPEPVAIVSGQVLDFITKKPVPSDVTATLVGDTTTINRVEFSPDNGEFRLILPVQKVYSLLARKTGYFPASEPLDLSKDKRFRDIRRNIYLIPIKTGQKMVLREVIFEQSKFDLLPSSNAELDRMVEMLQQFPALSVLVEGHTDNQGEWALNMKLSEDRVRVVKEYITGKGIAPERVQTKAWGPSKPIANNESEDRRKLNRRVEFTILTL
jgi:outer membrane protein OmpA-like peptidoglycan-associated protein